MKKFCESLNKEQVVREGKKRIGIYNATKSVFPFYMAKVQRYILAMGKMEEQL